MTAEKIFIETAKLLKVVDITKSSDIIVEVGYINQKDLIYQIEKINSEKQLTTKRNIGF